MVNTPYLNQKLSTPENGLNNLKIFSYTCVDKKQVPVLLLDLGEEYSIYFQAFVKRKLFITKIHETFMGIFRINVIK